MNPGTHLIGNWVGSTDDMISLRKEKKKSLGATGIRIPDPPARRLATVPCTVPSIYKLKIGSQNFNRSNYVATVELMSKEVVVAEFQIS